MGPQAAPDAASAPPSKMGDQLNYAFESAIPFMVLFGEDEINKGVVKIKVKARPRNACARPTMPSCTAHSVHTLRRTLRPRPRTRCRRRTSLRTCSGDCRPQCLCLLNMRSLGRLLRPLHLRGYLNSVVCVEF